jgi:membrane fusion protein (multidrug efflux system)
VEYARLLAHSVREAKSMNGHTNVSTRSPQRPIDKAERNRRLRIMLIFLGILFGTIFLYKTVMGMIIKHAIASQSHVVEVSSMKVTEAPWQPQLSAVGSVRAIKGVNVTTELAGMVQNIYFTPGATVKRGTVLVTLDIDADVAQLRALQATQDLDLITYNRDKKQYAAMGISKEQLDTDAANLKNMQAQVAQQAATVAKKIIQAPFDGRMGVSAVNPGQYLNPGDKVVSLQQLNPIYIDFYVPQQALSELHIGQQVNINSDTYPDVVFTGTISTIDPIVDTSTRNAEIEATVANPKLQLLPGMFTAVTVNTRKPENYITVPQTAITFNPYGDVVYLVMRSKNKDEDKKDKNKKDKNGETPIAVQRFVTTGETRGEQITVLKGLSVGDEVVTSGQLKLKNNDPIEINNSIVPTDKANPKLPDER